MTISLKVKKSKENVEQDVYAILGNISDFLRGKRNHAGLSIRELSRRSGVCIASICDAENYKRLPKVDILLRIAFALGISSNELFSNLIQDSSVPVPKDTWDSTLKVALIESGLSRTDIKEVVDFIKFKKSQKKGK